MWNDSLQDTSRISHYSCIFSFWNISKRDLVCVTVRKLLETLRLNKTKFYFSLFTACPFRVNKEVCVHQRLSRLLLETHFWIATAGRREWGESFLFSDLFKSDTLLPFTFYRPKQVIWLQLTSKKIVLPYAWKSEWGVLSVHTYD